MMFWLSRPSVDVFPLLKLKKCNVKNETFLSFENKKNKSGKFHKRKISAAL